jgi:hypothetical protein
MSRRRPGISAGHSSVSWAAKTMTVAPRVATCAPAPPPAIVRIHHPAIPAPEFKCYRVVRYYKQHDLVEVETIGWSRLPTPALQLMGCEIGKARVLDPNGRIFSDNGMPMESRP